MPTEGLYRVQLVTNRKVTVLLDGNTFSAVEALLRAAGTA